MTNVVSDEQQDEDVEEWLDEIKPIIEMNKDFKREREQQSQENNQDGK